MPATKWMRPVLALWFSCLTANYASADATDLAVEPLPAYSAGASVLVRGRAEPLAYIFVRNENRRVHTRADAAGAFSLAAPLEADEANRLTVYASPDSEGHWHKSQHVQLTTTSDTIAPTITASLSPPPNAAGWHRAPATVHFTCSDQGSGLEGCPADMLVSTPGAAQIVSGEAVDRAGNRTRASVSVSLDTNAPQIRLDGLPSGLLVQGNSLAISGSVNDDVSGVSALNCNAVPAQLSGERFNCAVPLRQGENTVRVWALDGAGNIGEARSSVVSGPRLPRGDAHESVISADVNGDGIGDIVRTHFANGTIGIAPGRADGTFAPEQWVRVGPYPTAVALLNAQGDLITAHYTTGEAAIHRRQADGSYLTATRFAIGAFPAALILADVNRDGRPDVLSVHAAANTLMIHLAQSDGSYRLQASLPVGTMPVALATGMVHGSLSIVTANFASDDASLIVADGKGGFAAEQRLALAPPLQSPSRQTLTSTRLGPAAIALADVSGDGIPEVLTANLLGGSISVLTRKPGGDFIAQVVTAGTGPSALAIGDLDGDGREDVIFARADGSLGSLRNTSTGFTAAQGVSEANGSSLLVRDVNGDGRADLIIIGAQGVDTLLNRGPQGFVRALSALDAMAYQHRQYLPFVGGPAATGTPVPHRSALQITNLAPAGNRISVTFLDASGKVHAQAQGVVPAQGAVRFDTLASLPPGWTGSVPEAGYRGAAIVSATRPLSVLHEITNNRGAREIHPGIAAADTSKSVWLPLVNHHFLGSNTRIFVQNAGTVSTHVTIGLRPQRDTYGQVARSGVSLDPGQSAEVVLDGLQIDGPNGFNGAAGLGSSDAPIAVLAIDDVTSPASPQLAARLQAYAGFGTSMISSELHVPLYLSHADRNMVGADWSSVLAVTNMGDIPTDIRIEPGENVISSGFSAAASPGPELDFKPCDSLTNPFAGRTETGVRAGDTIYVELGGTRPCRFAGPLKITSSDGAPLVALAVHSGANDRSAAPALPRVAAASEIVVPRVRSNAGVAHVYSEITARNLGDTEANVTITFSPNTVPGGVQPHDVSGFVGPGGLYYFDNLQFSGIHYEGSATLRTDNGQPLAVSVSEVPLDRFANDALASYVVPVQERTMANLKTLTLPDVLLVPGVCQPFADAVVRARDSTNPAATFLAPNLMQAIGQPCFRTDDEELNQRVFTQGIQLTGDLPTFLNLDPMPVTGGIPFLLVNTNQNWGTFQSVLNTQRATVATTTSTVASRGMTADAWGAYVYAGLAAVAAGALAQGLKDQLSRFDWYAGPTSALPSGPSVLDQNDELQKGLGGTGAAAAAASYGTYLDWAARHYDMLATGFPAPIPPNNDSCANGALNAKYLGLDNKFSTFQAVFKAPEFRGDAAHVFVNYIEARRFAWGGTCQMLRMLAACARVKGATELELSGFTVNPNLLEFLNRNFAHQALEDLDVWTIPVEDTPQVRALKVAKCLFFD